MHLFVSSRSSISVAPQIFSCSLWALDSLTRGSNPGPCIKKGESKPTDHQGSPRVFYSKSFITAFEGFKPLLFDFEMMDYIFNFQFSSFLKHHREFNKYSFA